MDSNYHQTYYEYEELSAAHPAWPLSEIRRLSVRERKHWLALARHYLEVREAARNG